jgi:biopolymer transport protein ExbB
MTGALALVVFVERALFYHQGQINTVEFLNGVRNVLRRENVVEAISICDATPGPVARLVKVAILNREKGREGLREALEEAGLVEIPQLKARLPLLATIAQLAPTMGLLGTVFGFIDVFQVLQQQGIASPAGELAQGVWQALVCTGMGLAIAIVFQAGYNYLISRVDSIVQDMEKSSAEIMNLLAEPRKDRAEPR